jgi:hypothetical protein
VCDTEHPDRACRHMVKALSASPRPGLTCGVTTPEPGASAPTLVHMRRNGEEMRSVSASFSACHVMVNGVTMAATIGTAAAATDQEHPHALHPA